MLGPLAVEDNGKKPSGSPPAARLPLLFRSPPTLPPLITRNPSRDPSPSSRTGPAPHQTVSHFEHRASPRKSKEHGHGCPPGGNYFPPGYRYPLGYPHAYSSSARQYHSSLPPTYTHPAEYYPVHVSTDRYYHAPPHLHYDLDDYLPMKSAMDHSFLMDWDRVQQGVRVMGGWVRVRRRRVRQVRPVPMQWP